MVFLNLSSGQGSSGRRRPSRAGSLKLTFPPWPLWLVSKLLEYKAGVLGRKPGIWKSRTARTSTF